MNLLKTSMAAAVLAASFAAPSFAGSLIQTVSTGGGSAATATGNETDQFSGPINFFQTEYALAGPAVPAGEAVELTGVVVVLQTYAKVGGTITNTANAAQNFYYETSQNASVQNVSNTPAPLIAAVGGAAGLSNNFGIDCYGVTSGPSGAACAGTQGGVGASSTAPYTIAGGAANSLSAQIGSIPSGTVALSDVGDFAGTGTFSDELVSTQLTTTTGNAISNALVTQGSVLTVEYIYTDVPLTIPEPATIAVLGAGLLGLGLVRRRKA